MNYFIFALTGGLEALRKTVVTDWLGPAYLLGVAVMAIIFLKDREFRKLGAFIVIAGVVGALIFAAPELFGKDKGVTKGVTNAVKKVQ